MDKAYHGENKHPKPRGRLIGSARLIKRRTDKFGSVEAFVIICINEVKSQMSLTGMSRLMCSVTRFPER